MKEYIREIISVLVGLVVLALLINIVSQGEMIENVLALFVFPAFVGVAHYGVTKVVELS